MVKMMQGHLVGEGLKIGLIQARWNDFMGHRLAEGALDAMLRHGVKESDILRILVPGSFEIPMVARRLVQRGDLDAVVCVGVLIRGGTAHFDLIAAEVTKGIAQVSIESGIPVTFGVVTADTIEQAVERSGSKSGNKGAEAAVAAIEMANLMQQLSASTK